MQEAEEQDTCRICSAPGEPGQPLFHPCKCSGTIRYIHQDCLTTWLSHSKKKTCDVCKHPYSFTKVYATDMPPSLPPLLLIRRLAQQAFFASLFGIRAILVATVWLALLPWITIWTWRVYFTMGESTAWWISGRERPAEVRPIGIVQSLTPSNETAFSFKNATILHHFTSRSFWQTLSSDIFAGQIIASLIVLVFVAVFLLREWISQNARPGVFEEDEIVGMPPQDPPVLNPPPANQLMQDVNVHLLGPQRRDPLLDGDLEARRQGRHWRPHRAIPPNAHLEAIQRRVEDAERLGPLRDPIRRPQNPRIDPHLVAALPLPLPPPENPDTQIEAGKGKEKEEEEESALTALEVRRRMRRRFNDDDGDECADSNADAGPSIAASNVASSSTLPGPVSGHSTAIESTPFEFTFRVPANTNTEEDIREPVPEMPAPSLVALQTAMITGTPIPEEGPRRRSIVFPPDSSPRAQSPRLTTPAIVHDDISPKTSHESSPPTSSNIGFRHLPVSNDSLAAEDGLGSWSFEGSTSGHFTALDHPSDVLAADSSSLSAGNVDRKKRTRDEMEDEFEHYFRIPPPPPLNAVDVDNDLMDVPHEVAPTFERDQVVDGEQRPQIEAAPEDEDDSDDDDGPERIFWDADADREDEDDEDDAVDPAEINIPNRPGGQPQPQAPAQGPVEQQLNDGVDDLEAAVEDDMEGALEAIGLRGPLFGLVQNVILMIFVLDTAIGFGIWLPFTLGKTAALLSLDPQRAFHILHLPIRGMRIMTDPFVDFFTLVLGRFLFPFFYKISGFVLSNATKRSEFTAVASLWLQSPPQERAPSLLQKINDFFESDSAIAQLLEPHFAHLGREVRLFTTHFQQSWASLTLGHGSSECAFAIILGYGVVGIILALYLNVFTVGNARTAGRAVRNVVRQQLLVVKVAMFIIIELIVFPLGCGTMLDACTIWVFPEASLNSRIAFFTQAPLTAMFYHWVAGTMFMYQFAVLLGGCRNIMRAGAMWFIKDPQDQNFHPIRDILDRPTFTQFRKLLISAFMYAMVVACGVGSLAVLLFIGNRSIFPIRWKTRTDREPLSDVPIDLLFLQIVLPYTMRYLRPRKVVYRMAVHVWKLLAAKLRLTSYMFGERLRDEESSKVHKNWVAFFRRSAKDNEQVIVTQDGTFRRVPASDNYCASQRYARHCRSNAEAVKAKRDIKDDYIVVYFPPRFRMRIIAFVAAIWTIMAIVAAIGIAVPVQLGRHFFALISSLTVHDGYSFLAGFYILWGCYLVAKAAESMDRRRQRVTGDGPRPDFAVYFAKQSLLWVTKITYMALFLGVLTPILLGLVVDVYIVLPIRLTFYPTMVPTIRLVDMWSLGLVYCKIVIRLRRRLQLPQRRYNAMHVLLSNGWTHPDPRHATKEIIVPLMASLLAMLLLPAGVVYVLRELLHLPLDKKFLFVHVYPGIFALVGLSRTVVSGMTLLSSWSQSIRDKEFLVEMQLQNFDSEFKAVEKKTEVPRVDRMERAIVEER
ncbi:hypothetical protein JVU11DRAFT_9928 [Chiua virens]|nr:hypothetical protein JVU11DRAFT_9928 [Chiua virens]